ncbi:MAG: TIGR00266 family protein [Spirochaetota bacterium]
MKTEILGSPSFSHVHVDLSPGESVIAEADAMQSMSADLDMKAIANGGFFSALGKKLFGGESFFVNRFTNSTSGVRRVTIAQDVPGEIAAIEVREGHDLCLQRGAFLASTDGVRLKAEWAGFASFVAGEGLVKLRASGSGTLFYGAYGGMLKRVVHGELKVDDGHLVAYDPSLKLKIAMAGGFFASVFGGEGLVTRVIGEGTVYIQTRSIRGLAAWLNPKFR